MSFRQCLELEHSYLAIEGKILGVCRNLAAAYRRTHVYSTASMMRLCGGNADPESPTVLQALLDIGVIEKTITEICARCNFTSDMCICGTPLLVSDERYIVKGDLMALPEGIRAAGRYFISFYTHEAQIQAEALHSELSACGLDGFLSCSNLSSGDQWRREIMGVLKSSSVFICIESANYHVTPNHRCSIERDYAILAGMPFLRIGLCPFESIQNPPLYVSNIQHDCFVDSHGNFQLRQGVFSQELPSRLELDVRMQGARSLLMQLSAPVIRDLALQLHISNQIPSTLSDMDLRSEFLGIVFCSTSLANQLWNIIDLVPVF